MAEPVKIGGETYTMRSQLGVLGLSIVTLGIYSWYWYYKVNDEARRFLRDETISPARSLLAVTLGWVLLAPPFIAMHNTAKHLRAMEERVGFQRTTEPMLATVILLFFPIVPVGIGVISVYLQGHLNRVWHRATRTPSTPGARGRRAPKRKKRRG